MNETRALQAAERQRRDDRFWLKMGEALGQILLEELGKRDRRLTKLERTVERLERRGGRTDRGRAKS